MPLRSLHHVGMHLSPPRALYPSWTALRLRHRGQYLHSLRLHRHGVSGRRRSPLASGRTFSPDTPTPRPPSDLDRRPSRPLLAVALITHSIHPLLADVLESCRTSFRGVGGVHLGLARWLTERLRRRNPPASCGLSQPLPRPALVRGRPLWPVHRLHPTMRVAVTADSSLS